ncbi:hypothetical protein [Mariniluteicoccus flavus]
MNTTSTSRRSGSASPLRRASQFALSAGLVLAIASAFGSVWVVRAGLVVLAIGAVLAVRFAWQELRQSQAEHGQALSHIARSQGASIAAERRRTGEVLDALRDHNGRADAAVRELEGTIGELKVELNTLRGANAGLKADLAERDHRISTLRRDLASREAELRTLQEIEDDAEVLAMPRHAAGSDWDALPTAEDLFADGDHPTVVDLQKLAFPAVEAEVRKQA